MSLPGGLIILLLFLLSAAELSTILIVSTEVSQTTRSTELYKLIQTAIKLGGRANSTPVEARTKFANDVNNHELIAWFDQVPAVKTIIADSDEIAAVEDLVMGKIGPLGIVDIRIDLTDNVQANPANNSIVANDFNNTDEPLKSLLRQQVNPASQRGQYVIALQLADDSWFNFILLNTFRPSILNHNIFIISSIISVAILALGALLVYFLTKPYREFQRAALKIAEDIKIPPLKEMGTSEVRGAARAVNLMQSMVLEHLADREHLAAALAHDLRTPLTRLKLRSELITKRSLKSEVQADIKSLQAIINSVVDFASLTNVVEKRQRVDLISLVESIVEEVRGAKMNDESQTKNKIVINLQPIGISRCLKNIIENAVRYGKIAVVSINANQKTVAIHVDDQGPGIPIEHLKNVMRPFVRLEKSRNRSSGGSGLGLAIADTIARANAGKLTLENRPAGGLRVKIEFPVL